MFDNFEILLETFLKSKICPVRKKNKKKIQFSKYIYIHLIPSYRELINYQYLWWSQDELINTRLNASKEIIELKNKLPFITMEDAKKLLYQPNNITYNENNFISSLHM
jgi:hypothetical protein